ncbi:MAG TPA: YebC/PmpR family DNA-binding transcriptional regulator [Candidatus Kaiserbacteria bacterium]|nr:YebC/PmpR family DNA-binding transcriptional regulator [Candidatus Kaiserbacteria bacterium]
MSGHNKWSKIKHKKAATDAQKSKVFGKIAKLIAVESKKTSGDINSPELRSAIEKAKQVNMPTDNINRAVQKGKTDTSTSLEEVLYEVYGPGGVAIIILGLTDNKNRTAAEIKHLLSKQDLSLAGPGAAMWAFEKDGDEYKPNTTTSISKEEGLKLKNVVEIILEHDDVQDVFTNELLSN